MNRDNIEAILIVVGLVAMVAFASFSACEAKRRHDEIRRTCKPFRHESGSVVPVFTGKGSGVGFVSDKTCYRCPDGWEECI